MLDEVAAGVGVWLGTGVPEAVTEVDEGVGRSAWSAAWMSRLVVPDSFLSPERAEQTRTTRLPESIK